VVLVCGCVQYLANWGLGYTSWKLKSMVGLTELGCHLPSSLVLLLCSLVLAFRLSLLLNVRLLGVSVVLHPQTETEAEHRSLQMLKPKPKAEKTKISVRFGAVRFSSRFSV
jgi:hypothetical protein